MAPLEIWGHWDLDGTWVGMRDVSPSGLWRLFWLQTERAPRVTAEPESQRQRTTTVGETCPVRYPVTDSPSARGWVTIQRNSEPYLPTLQ